MEEWKEYKLGDCVEAVIDNRGKSAPTKPLGEFPLLEINSIGGYYPNYSVIRKYVDKVTYNTWFRSGHPICGDILIPTVGTIGIISIMDNHKACIAQNLIALRTKKEISNIFIYYFLKSPIVKKQLINLDIGGVQPSIKVPHLLNLSISLPEKDIQHKIASILSSLDDKIEVNRKINENLEQQAQALFKSWFVDFEPFKNGEFVESELGMIPKGWRVEALTSFGKIVCGKTPSKSESSFYGGNIPFIKIPDMHNKVFVGLSEDNLSQMGDESQPAKRIPPYSILVSCIATVGLVCINTKESHTNQQINTIIPYSSSFRYYLYQKMLSLKDYLINLGRGGTATLNVNTKVFGSIKIIKPTDELLLNYDKQVSSLFNMIEANQQESRRLAELRDTLLPKLMSGELEVNEIAN